MSTSLTTTEHTSLTIAQALPIDRNPAAVYIAALSPGSRRTMTHSLNTIAEMVSGGHHDALSLPWHELRFQHTAAIRAQLAERYKPNTANKMLSALRQVLKRCWRLGIMSREDYARAADLEGIQGETLPAGRAITGGELAALMDTCANDPSSAGARDAAIVAVLYSCGLRRAELVGLDLADWDGEACEITVRNGKRGKERIVPVVNGTVDALEDWLAVRGAEEGPLFVAIRKGGHIQHGQALTTEAIWHMLKRRAKSAGVTRLSPHDFRRSFITDLWAIGANPVAIQKLAGHANIDTTARYDRSGEEAKRKAAELLHVPYRRRRMV